EGAGGVALVVFQEHERGTAADAPAQRAAREQFFLEPGWQRGAEAAQAGGRECQGGFQEALELGGRFVVEGGGIELGRPEVAGAQAVGDGVSGEAGVVFLAGKALFLGGGHHVAVHDQRGGAVVVERGDAEDGGHAGSLPAGGQSIGRKCTRERRAATTRS